MKSLETLDHLQFLEIHTRNIIYSKVPKLMRSTGCKDPCWASHCQYSSHEQETGLWMQHCRQAQGRRYNTGILQYCNTTILQCTMGQQIVRLEDYFGSFTSNPPSYS